MTQTLSSSQLRTLRNASESVIRVTEQLKDLVYEIANLISNNLENWDIIQTSKQKYYIVEDEKTGYKFLVTDTRKYTTVNVVPAICFDVVKEKTILTNSEEGLIFELSIPSRDDYKQFAEDLKEILTETQKIIDSRQNETEAIITQLKKIIN